MTEEPKLPVGKVRQPTPPNRPVPAFEKKAEAQRAPRQFGTKNNTDNNEANGGTTTTAKSGRKPNLSRTSPSSSAPRDFNRPLSDDESEEIKRWLEEQHTIFKNNNLILHQLTVLLQSQTGLGAAKPLMGRDLQNPSIQEVLKTIVDNLQRRISPPHRSRSL